MPLFAVRGNKASDSEIAKKSKTKAKQPVSVKSDGLLATLTVIKTRIDEILGKHVDEYEIITDKNRLKEYIEISNHIGYIAIDTETTGLDPISDKIVGLCLYTNGEKAVYVPINHTSYVTGARVDNQMKENDVADCLRLLTAKVIMFNAKFDIRVIRNQLGVYLTCYWDCYLASRLMNENEPEKGLKALHQKYVLEDAEDEFNFESLFSGISADKVPISSFYLYAAHDAIITYEYWAYQMNYMYYNPSQPLTDRNGMNGVAWVFFNIEMPCVNVVCDMEDIGIELDLDYAHQLSDTYNERLQAKSEAFYEILSKYTSQIETFVSKHKNVKLDNPINIASTSQLATLFYDILNVESVDRKHPRGTGEDILKKIAEQRSEYADLCNAILEYREVAKLINTYIDKLPKCINSKDGRLHCSFNQYGADTGRFSSSDPNLQNIPSHNKDIRKMFKATDDETYVNSIDNSFTVDRWCEVNTESGWKYADSVQAGDVLFVDEDGVTKKIIVSMVKTVVDNSRIVYYY